MQVLAGGKENLIRSLSIQNRKIHRKESLAKYLHRHGKTVLTGNEFVLIVQFIQGNNWKNITLVADPKTTVMQLQQAKRFKQTQNQSIGFCTAKNQKVIGAGISLQKVYQDSHDRADEILYLRLMRQNSF